MIDWDDWIRDSNNKRRYKTTCGLCSKDRGYQRAQMREKLCMSCGQTGKQSSLKGKARSDEFKLSVSNANLRWRKLRDPDYQPMGEIDKRVVHNIRCRLWQLLKGKKYSMSKALSCSSFELKEHLEKQFQLGMTWDNYGRIPSIKCWEIDHIRPLSSFDLTNETQFNEACYYENLQPMWIEDNRSKGDKQYGRDPKYPGRNTGQNNQVLDTVGVREDQHRLDTEVLEEVLPDAL